MRIKTEKQTVAPKRESALTTRKIVIRVVGGFVEEVQGNPLPVRVYDYDCAKVVSDSDVDERGRACIISEFQPAARQ
jgi:hypothetical protein